MSPQPPPSVPRVAENLGVFLRHIMMALAGRVSWSTLPPLLVCRVGERMRAIKLRVERIAALVRDGRYVARHRSTPASPGARPPPPRPDPAMREFGWLAPLLPHMQLPRGGFLALLRDPEMVALIQAAPAPPAQAAPARTTAVRGGREGTRAITAATGPRLRGGRAPATKGARPATTSLSEAGALARPDRSVIVTNSETRALADGTTSV